MSRNASYLSPGMREILRRLDELEQRLTARLDDVEQRDKNREEAAIALGGVGGRGPRVPYRSSESNSRGGYAPMERDWGFDD